ncbi:MAG: hypothetical protein JOZ18_05910 [Chloroflexi bacterium]|nr:hypothetical protein [Chloroflexota bacterium]
MLKAYHTFSACRYIWPDQHRRIASLLEVLGEVVQAFCKLLADPALLPPSVAPNRYLLLATLQHMDEQIKILHPLIITFRSIHKSSSEQVRKLRLEIEHNLELLVQSCQDSLKHFQVLSDQTHFEEKKLEQFASNQPKPEAPGKLYLLFR